MIKYMCRDAGLNKVEVLNLYRRIPLSFWHTKATQEGYVQNLFYRQTHFTAIGKNTSVPCIVVLERLPKGSQSS